MDSQELRNLQEAYIDVYQLDEDKRPIYGRGGAIRKTETPLQIYGKQATAKDKRTKHNIPKGGTTIDRRDSDELFSGDYDRGSGNAAKRRAAALTKPEAKKFPNRLTRSDKQGIKDSFDLYDIILSHLLDEGYAETQEQAQVIMVNMSEDWRESICEEYKKLPLGKMMRKVQKRATRESDTRAEIEYDPTFPTMKALKAAEKASRENKRSDTMIKVADEHDPKKSKRKEDDNRREGGRKRDAGRPRRNELQDNW